MNHRERFEFNQKTFGHLFKLTPEQSIERLVNVLIDALYIPELDYESVTRTDPKRIMYFEIDNGEPINWGDLKCCKVRKREEDYLVVIDEAAPNDCPTFCEYITKYMKSYGWNVEVQTEW